MNTNKKVSLAFVLLAVYCLLSLSGLTYVFTGFISIFRPFAPMKVVYYLLTAANNLVPFALLAVLYLNTKQDMKRIGGLICLAGAALKAYSIFTIVKNMIMMIMGGADISTLIVSISNLVGAIVVAILLILAYQYITKGKKCKATAVIAILGGFCYFFAAALALMFGYVSIINMVKPLILIIALCYLPGTVCDYKTATMANKTNLKIVVILLVVALIIPAIALSSANSSSRKSSSKYGSSVSGQPWKELGVSEREYMEIYNKFKYGN